MGVGWSELGPGKVLPLSGDDGKHLHVRVLAHVGQEAGLVPP